MKNKPYHRKLYQYIVEELGQRIVQGRYQAPDVLPTEDKLCEELSVSRGVLREATKVLTQKGLIQTRPRVGTQVLPRDCWNLFDADVLLWRLQVEDKFTFLKTVTEVRRIIDILAPGGGFVLNSVHNIQNDVAADNIVAMFDEANAYRPGVHT